METKINLVGESAIGSIGPDPRISTGEITLTEVEEFAERLATDEFYEPVGELGPNAAGGTFTLVIADALTTQRFRQPGAKAAEHAKYMYRWLVEERDTPENRNIIPRQCIDGRPVAEGSEPCHSLIGDHDSNHGKDDCGAEKMLPQILDFIVQNAAVLREVAVSEGIDVDDATHLLIINNAMALIEEAYPSDAFVLRDAFKETAGEKCISCLDGNHAEVAARKNRDKTITLNRAKIQAIYGNRLEAFNIDAGVFEDAAKVISFTEVEVSQKTVAMEYYNTATALVLVHPSLRYIA